MNSFSITKADRFLVYGAAYLGRDILKRLQSAGYSVDGFLDKRAEELQSVEGLKVVDPERFEGDRADIIVCIATSNPNSVANNLLSLGYRKIIYNTFDYHIDNKEVNIMSEAYHALLQGTPFPGQIPCYSETMDLRFLNGAFIRETDSEVTAFVPSDMLFSSDDGREEHIYGKYYDLLQYLRFFEAGQENMSTVINTYSDSSEFEAVTGCKCGLSPEERRTYTHSLLNFYSLKLNYGIEWFQNHPVHVTKGSGESFLVRENEVFQIMFLISRGIQRIPAVMSAELYQRWLNDSSFPDLLEYAQNNDLRFSYTLLEHPYLFYFPGARDIGSNSRMFYICHYLRSHGIRLDGKKLIDIGSYYGFLSRFFYRMGAKVVSAEYDAMTFEMSMKINSLLHCEEIEGICGGAETIDRPDEFDMSVMLTVLYWHLETDIGIALIKNVDAMTRKYLLWESGDEPEREKEFIRTHSSFQKYDLICETVGTGKTRELGIWSK